MDNNSGSDFLVVLTKQCARPPWGLEHHKEGEITKHKLRSTVKVKALGTYCLEISSSRDKSLSRQIISAWHFICVCLGFSHAGSRCPNLEEEASLHTLDRFSRRMQTLTAMNYSLGTRIYSTASSDSTL